MGWIEKKRNEIEILRYFKRDRWDNIAQNEFALGKLNMENRKRANEQIGLCSGERFKKKERGTLNYIQIAASLQEDLLHRNTNYL